MSISSSEPIREDGERTPEEIRNGNPGRPQADFAPPPAPPADPSEFRPEDAPAVRPGHPEPVDPESE